MHLTISQRAWEPELEEAVLPMLHSMGVKALELAPPKLRPHLLQWTHQQLDDYAGYLGAFGIKSVALQSLLSFIPDLSLFGNDEQRQKTTNKLVAMAPLAARLGAKKWVFGSFQVRKRNELSSHEADGVMSSWLCELGNQLAVHGIQFLIEAVPALYGADYLTGHDEVAELVTKVAHPNIGFHLDLGTCYLENPSEKHLSHWASMAQHVHVSVPHFGVVHEFENIPHKIYAEALQHCKASYLSIEMFEKVTQGMPLGSALDNLKQSIAFVQEQYQSVLD